MGHIVPLYTATKRAGDHHRIGATARLLQQLHDDLALWEEAFLGEFGGDDIGDTNGATLAFITSLRRTADFFDHSPVVSGLVIEGVTLLVATGGEFLAALLGLILMGHQAHCRLQIARGGASNAGDRS